MHSRVIIIGGGQAAAQFAQSARQAGFAGHLTLIGAETSLPYQRPPLSKKYLAGELERDRLLLKPGTFYSDQGIEVLTGRQVVDLRSDKQQLELDDGQILNFDRLAMATGAAPRRLSVPGSELQGIHYLRSISDVDAIREGLREDARVVIIGAGYIGLEAAAACRSRGFEVTILEAGPRALGRVVCKTTADFYTRLHTERGVHIVCGSGIEAFTGADRVQSVRTADGTEHPCDVVIVGIGVTPAISLAETAGLECMNGIAVDACARTSHPNILALGDCTSQPHPLIGARIRLESVQNAIEQGRSAAWTLMGEQRPFEAVPWFWSDQYDIKLQIAGLAREYDQIAIRGAPDSNRFAVFYLNGRELVAADAINSPREFLAAKQLIQAGAQVSAEQLADPTAELKALA